MNKSTIVYWAYAPVPEKNTYISMMLKNPIPLFKTLPERSSVNARENYINCRGLPNLYKNTFLVTSPIDADISVNYTNDNTHFWGTGTDFFIGRPRPFKNMNSVDLDFSYIFFSEESLELSQIPAFLHKTTFSENAFIASGSFDISKWFRPIFPSFIFWENSSNLVLKKDDPLYYLDFKTNKNVILKQFDFTKDIYEIMSGCISYRNNNPLKTLNYLYDRFLESKRNEKLIKLIKQNILDN
jgi:hypothetical protein